MTCSLHFALYLKNATWITVVQYRNKHLFCLSVTTSSASTYFSQQSFQKLHCWLINMLLYIFLVSASRKHWKNKAHVPAVNCQVTPKISSKAIRFTLIILALYICPLLLSIIITYNSYNKIYLLIDQQFCIPNLFLLALS